MVPPFLGGCLRLLLFQWFDVFCELSDVSECIFADMLAALAFSLGPWIVGDPSPEK